MSGGIENIKIFFYILAVFWAMIFFATLSIGLYFWLKEKGKEKEEQRKV